MIQFLVLPKGFTEFLNQLQLILSTSRALFWLWAEKGGGIIQVHTCDWLPVPHISGHPGLYRIQKSTLDQKQFPPVVFPFVLQSYVCVICSGSEIVPQISSLKEFTDIVQRN